MEAAIIFPMIFLGALWNIKLEGVWLNFVGVNLFSGVLGLVLLLRVIKEIRLSET